jgi:acetyltransferase-like isoleucine patch superfamily enzyme
MSRKKPIDDYKEKYEKIRVELARRLKKKYNRVLPVDEMLSDRWKKGDLLGFGQGTNAYENVYVYGEPKVGKNVWIGPMVLLDATGGLEIGDNCEISSGAMIFTHSTHLRCVSGRKAGVTQKPVIIGDDVYVGSGVIILQGVTIGHNSIIGAGSVVTADKDIPSFSVAMGAPAEIVGKVVLSNDEVRIEYSRDRRVYKKKRETQ